LPTETQRAIRSKQLYFGFICAFVSLVVNSSFASQRIFHHEGGKSTKKDAIILWFSLCLCVLGGKFVFFCFAKVFFTTKARRTLRPTKKNVSASLFSLCLFVLGGKLPSALAGGLHICLLRL
jgi:4-amino-4-deoxy-L-arabinose transferase-like glycosyltransferase